MSKRIPTSVHKRGKFTVRIYDEQAYAENIAQYYVGDETRSHDATALPPDRVPFEKKKPGSRYNWASWRGGPMIKAETA